MGMAMTEAEKQKEHERKMREAVEVIRKNESLRYFITDYMGELGPLATPFAPDPHQTAFLAGMQNAAYRLVERLNEFDPLLFPALLKEAANEPAE